MGTCVLQIVDLRWLFASSTQFQVLKTSVCCIITASTSAKLLKATANKLYPYELCFINLSVLFCKNNGQFQVKLDKFHYALLDVAYILFYGTD